MFETKYVGATFSVISVISELLVNTTAIFLAEVILDGDQKDYLVIFSITACGPAIAFVVTMFFRPTPQDAAKREKCCK